MRLGILNFFLAGFGYIEGWEFIDDVFKRYPPKPKILIINEDGFFDRPRSEPARQILEHPVASSVDAELKNIAQPIGAELCRTCGAGGIIVRSRKTGQWYMTGFNDAVGDFPVTPSPPPAEAAMAAWLTQAEPQARELIADASATCVILTDAPSDGSIGAYARALGSRIGAEVVLPDVAGLRTIDGGHLDAQSAVNWSNAFLEGVR